MTRRSFCLALGILVLLLLTAAAIVVGMVRYEPAIFAHSPLPTERQSVHLRSDEFKGKLTALISAINNNDRVWDEQFTDEQINSYFDEDFVQSGLDRRLLPQGISQPRVAFEEDKVRLAFRCGTGTWSTVISIDLRVWLPTCEKNVVALELEGFWAGALPITVQSLLEHVSEVGRQSNVDVSWYRHKGHPVALLRFGTESPRTTVELKAVQLQPGSISIKGAATESGQPRAVSLAPEAVAPDSGN